MPRFVRKPEFKTDAQLTADHWKSLTDEFKIIFKHHTNRAFPIDPYQQLEMAIQSVFQKLEWKNGPSITVTLQVYPTILVRQ